MISCLCFLKKFLKLETVKPRVSFQTKSATKFIYYYVDPKGKDVKERRWEARGIMSV